MAKPVTPKEARIQKVNFIPSEVIEATNELIITKLSKSGATVKLKEIIELSKRKMILNQNNAASEDFYSRGWLDVEPIFEEAGWIVRFNKPDYTESYDAYFEFAPNTRAL